MQSGLIPYRDFEFAYGPTMLYVPHILGKFTGLPVDAAYLAALWIFAWGGLFLLWWVIRQARASKRDKTVTFLLLAAFPALNPEFGLSYTMTRYVSGFAALMAARIAVEKLGGESGGGLRLDGAGRWFLVALCHFLLVAATFSISPEMGLAFFVALAVYWLLEYQAGSKWLLYTAAVHLLLLAGLAILVPPNTFLSIRGFSGGGNNLPLFPSPYVLLYLGSLMVAIVPMLADTARAIFGQGQGQALRSRVFGTLTGAFVVFSVAMIPAALDRPDTGHVLYNGTGVFLLTMLTPWVVSTRAIRKGDKAIPLRLVYQAAFFLIFPVLSVAMGRGYMLPGLKYLASLRVAEWSDQHPQSVPAQVFEKALGEGEWKRLHLNLLSIRQRSLENSFPYLDRYGKICDPVGESEIFSILGRHDALQFEYYLGVSDESPLLEVRRKLDDVSTCTFAILPRGALVGQAPALPLDQDYYSKLLMFPVWGPPNIPLPAPKVEFFKFVKAAFVPVRQVTPGMYLCVKRPVTPSP
jgi:hypothetical protein